MLASHFAKVEETLLSQAGVPGGAGHPDHKGTPREVFIREFLEKHLSKVVSIGTGEIIDCDSRPGEKRRQIDIIVAKSHYPEIDFGGGIQAYLVESVAATIEVKSKLTKGELRKAVRAAQQTKLLKRALSPSFSIGHIPPNVCSYVVAYDGPARMSTVYSWIEGLHTSLGILPPKLPLDLAERVKVASPALDGIFVLGKGFIYFDNTPIGLVNEEMRKSNPNYRWLIVDKPAGSLLFLFLLLTAAISGFTPFQLDMSSYLSTFSVRNPLFGE